MLSPNLTKAFHEHGGHRYQRLLGHTPLPLACAAHRRNFPHRLRLQTEGWSGCGASHGANLLRREQREPLCQGALAGCSCQYASKSNLPHANTQPIWAGRKRSFLFSVYPPSQEASFCSDDGALVCFDVNIPTVLLKMHRF